jgi:hypothetical protein
MFPDDLLSGINLPPADSAISLSNAGNSILQGDCIYKDFYDTSLRKTWHVALSPDYGTLDHTQKSPQKAYLSG